VLAGRVQVLREAHHADDVGVVGDVVAADRTGIRLPLHRQIVVVLAAAHADADGLADLALRALAVGADVVAGDVRDIDPQGLQDLALVGGHGHVDADQRDVGVALGRELQRGVEAALAAAAVAGQADQLVLVVGVAALGLHGGAHRVRALLRELPRRLVVDLLVLPERVEIGADLHLRQRRPVDGDLAAAVGVAVDAHREIRGRRVLRHRGDVVDGIEAAGHAGRHVWEVRAGRVGGDALGVLIAGDVLVDAARVRLDVADAAERDADERALVLPAGARLLDRGALRVRGLLATAAASSSIVGAPQRRAHAHRVRAVHGDRAADATRLLGQRLAVRGRIERRRQALQRAARALLGRAGDSPGLGRGDRVGTGAALRDGRGLLGTARRLRLLLGRGARVRAAEPELVLQRAHRGLDRVVHRLAARLHTGAEGVYRRLGLVQQRGVGLGSGRFQLARGKHAELLRRGREVLSLRAPIKTVARRRDGGGEERSSPRTQPL
jgi:hypothetical protein